MRFAQNIATATALAAALLAPPAGAHGGHGGQAGDPRPAGEAGAGAAKYDAKSTGTRKLVAGPVTIRMLAEASNLGRDDIEVGELILPPEASPSGAHTHGSLELFYVLEGVLGHEVNGVEHALHPGDLGIVAAGDTVEHAVLSAEPVRALVIWVPGGEADAIVERGGFESVPIAGEH